MWRSPLLSNTHATRGACDALVRPYGNGALSTCSIVKFSPEQTTGSNALPTVTTRNWNDVFNTVAHYHRRTITRRMDLAAFPRCRTSCLAHDCIAAEMPPAKNL